MFQTLGYYICMPFAALVRFFYTLTNSYGLAIILFTIVIKLIMLPFQMKSKRNMIRMNRMSGKMTEIRKKYANNQAKANEEIQKLYQEEGVNPMGGCLWTMIPLPILIALYSILRQPITHFMSIKKDVALSLVDKVASAGLDISTIATVKDGVTEFTPYGQIALVKLINEQLPQAVEGIEKWFHIDFNFIGLDLTVHPWDAVKAFEPTWAVIGLILIPILAGGFQFLMTIMTMKQSAQQGANAGQTQGMMYMMCLFSVYIAFIMPGSLGIYWIAQTVFSMVQEFFMNKFYNKKIEEEERIRYEQIQAERQKRQEEGRRLQEERKRKQAEEQKLSLKEKQKAAHAAKAAKAAKAATGTTEAGRVGNRPYAKGRAYKEDRYND